MDHGSSPAQASAAAYRCPSCSAEMTFDPNAGMLRCGHCGATQPIGGPAPGQAIVEHRLDQGLAQTAQRGLGTPVRSTRCQECGAAVSFPENVTSTTCEFCGSSHVLTQEANRNLIRPESVVPFRVDGAAAAGLFRKWLGSLWFRPSDLQRRARVAAMSGVYVPYWTFDAQVQSNWTAQAGYFYYETETYWDQDEKGNKVQRTRQVQKTRWQPAWGSRQDAYDDVLVCASRGLPAELARKLGTFDTRGLQPYDPAFLAGWKAEEYAVELDAGWAEAAQIMEASQRSRCAADVPGDTHQSLHVTSRYWGQTWKHVLLPIWIATFRYGDKPYRFLVNGQTGEVEGKAPWSVVKIVLFAAAILAGLGLLGGLLALCNGGG